jgi:tellurite resistance protein
MHPEQQQAILTIALLAAFADGANAEREREQIRRLAESLAETEGAPDLPALYQKVLLKQASLADTAAVLPDPSLRQLAYEMAVGVCDADGHANEAERRFLAELATVLGLEAAVTDPLRAEAEAMADLAESAAPRISTTLSTTIDATTSGPVVASVPNVPDSALDKSILNHAILNGALELLPQSWASPSVSTHKFRYVRRAPHRRLLCRSSSP